MHYAELKEIKENKGDRMQINNAGQGKKLDIEKLKLEETQLSGEITELEGEYSNYEAERTLEMSGIEGDLFENMSFIATKNQEVTQADGNRATAESNASTARSEMQTAQEDTNAKNADLTAKQGEATQAQGEASEAASSLNAANSALAQATSNVNAAQGEVNAASGEVSSAQSQLNAAEGQKSGWDKLKDAVKSAISNAINAAKSLLSKAMAKLNSAKAKLQEMLGIKQDKEKEAQDAKIVSDEAQEALTKKQEEVQKANELFAAAQTILDSKTGEYEISEEELAAAIEVVENARAEQAEAQAKNDELNGKKSEVQEKYESVLSQVSNLIDGKEVDLEKIRSEIYEMDDAAFEQGKEVAVEEYLKATLEMEAIDIGTEKPKTAADKARKEEFEEKKKALDDAILSGDEEAIKKAYKDITNTEYDYGTAAELAYASNYTEAIFGLEEGYAFGNDVNKEAIDKALKKEMKDIMNDFENAVDGQGTLGDITNCINNFVGLGTSEKEAREKLEKYEQMVNRLETCTNPTEYAAIYKAITGKELTRKSAEELVSGTKQITNSKINETVERYKDTQASIADGSIIKKSYADAKLENTVSNVKDLSYDQYKRLRESYLDEDINIDEASEITSIINGDTDIICTKLADEKYDIVNNIVHGPRQDKDFAKEIEEIGKQYGVEIKIDNNVVSMEWAKNHPEAELGANVMDDDFAEQLANSLAMVESYGQVLPERINITNMGDTEGYMGCVCPSVNKDMVNISSSNYVAISGNDQDSLTATLSHETAHLDDYGQTGGKEWYSEKNKDINISENAGTIIYKKNEKNSDRAKTESCSVDSIEKYIGWYATTENVEFVAETTTLIANGTIVKGRDGKYTIKGAEKVETENGTVLKCDYMNAWNDHVTEVNEQELQDIMELYNTMTGGYDQLRKNGLKGRK